MTSEPLTVDELERAAGNFATDYNERDLTYSDGTLDHVALMRLLVEFTRKQLGSHSRQLWLEAPWISVSERLPEKSYEYLVVREGQSESEPADWFGDVWKTVRGYGYDCEAEELHDVTHWCELPKPPKAERTPKPSPEIIVTDGLVGAAIRLLHARSHTTDCRFTGCTCGAAADFRDALADLSRELQAGGRYLRELSPEEKQSKPKSPALPREEK